MLIVIKHFNKFPPVVSIPIHPKAEMYKVSDSGMVLDLNAQPQFSWKVKTKVNDTWVYEFVGSRASYTPRVKDVNSVIELTVTFELAGGHHEFKQECTQPILPRVPRWSERNLKMIKGNDVGTNHYKSSVLVYTYNVMSDTYVDIEEMSPSAAARLNWIHRMDNATNEINILNPDIILLQEVEEHALNSVFKNKNMNYSFFYKAKVDHYMVNRLAFRDEEGLCIGIKKGKFSICEPHLIDFDSHWHEIGSQHQLDPQVYNKSNVSIVVVLKEAEMKKNIIIANVHFSSLEARARMFQLGSLLKYIVQLSDYSADTTIIIGGDFNADPKRDVVAALKEGKVKKIKNDRYSPYSELSNIVSLKFPKMSSAYEAILALGNKIDRFRENNNEPYTFYNKQRMSTRDYIMYTNAACVEVLQMLSRDELLQSTLPSDHISLASTVK